MSLLPLRSHRRQAKKFWPARLSKCKTLTLQKPLLENLKAKLGWGRISVKHLLGSGLVVTIYKEFLPFNRKTDLVLFKEQKM